MDAGKTPLQFLMLLIMGAMLAGCGALVVGGAPAGGHDAAAKRTGAAGTSHDAAITASINSRYVNDRLVDALAIRVTTYQGVVTLQGSVRSEAAAARAVELARSTPHVRRVVSRLTVVP
jgi:osmotically-inducible protein OsmY